MKPYASIFVLTLAIMQGQRAPAAADLSGRVSAAGRPVAGATLTAAQGDKKVTSASDESGRYSFDRLGPGVWSVTVEMFGFASQKRQITLAGEPASADWNLELRRAQTPAKSSGARREGFQPVTVNQSAEAQVQAALPQISETAAESSDANESFLVTGSQSRGLSAAQQEDLFQQRSSSISSRRQRSASQPAAIPGQPAGGSRAPGIRGGGQSAARRPGRLTESRSGNRSNRTNSNALHGVIFLTARNSALDARPFSLTGQTVEKPSYAYNRFGGTLGGPLRIPKVFTSEKTSFSINYAGTRSRQPFSAVATVPTFAERAGDFSSRSQIYDPRAALSFAANRIPEARQSRAAVGLLRFMPIPNQPGAIQNYQFVTSTARNIDNIGVRLNHTLRAKDSLSFNLNTQNRGGNSAQLYGFKDKTEGRSINLSASWIRNLGPSLVNRLSGNFSRNRSETLPFFAFGPNVAAELGIRGTSSDPINYGPPNLSFTNFGALKDASAVLRRDQASGVGDSVTHVHRNHNITAGGEYRRMQLNTRTDHNARGTFAFSGLATSALDAQGLPLAGTGYDLADFLLGLPQSSSVQFGSASTYFRGSAYSAFGLDDWRVRPNLTLNLGLRYEFFTPLSEKYGRIANLDVAPGFAAVAVVTPGATGPYTGRFPEALIDPDKNNLSPRVAVAWRPFAQRRLQVRVGYGVFYNGAVYNHFPSRLASQPPFANTAVLTTSLARPLTLEDGFARLPSTQITNTYAIDRGYRLGYAQTWNFSVQHELPHALIVELGYLGTKGTRLDIRRLPNRAAPGSPLTAEQRRQIGNAVGFTFDSSEGNSNYHAGQVRVSRRLRRGLSFNALYTFSKSIDNASTFGGGAATVVQNDKDLSAERGLSSFDQSHTLSLFYVLTSPVRRSHGWAARLLESWNLSGGITAASGTPLTARVLGNLSDSSGTGAVGSGRADATGLPVGAGRFFNLAAFTPPPSGRFGNAARNTIPGPGTLALSLSVGRSFRLSEQRRLEFRIDSENFTNHVSFASLATVVNATNYGLPIAARHMRSVSATMRLRF